MQFPSQIKRKINSFVRPAFFFHIGPNPKSVQQKIKLKSRDFFFSVEKKMNFSNNINHSKSFQSMRILYIFFSIEQFEKTFKSWLSSKAIVIWNLQFFFCWNFDFGSIYIGMQSMQNRYSVFGKVDDIETKNDETKKKQLFKIHLNCVYLSLFCGWANSKSISRQWNRKLVSFIQHNIHIILEIGKWNQNWTMR